MVVVVDAQSEVSFRALEPVCRCSSLARPSENTKSCDVGVVPNPTALQQMKKNRRYEYYIISRMFAPQIALLLILG
jgi:hypothetical protein